jgi:LuxR family maltose regulon positive regulatory protein
VNAQILSTKLHIPSHRKENIDRKALVDQLSNGLDKKLTLVSAPAGFGKSSVVANWTNSLDCGIAWLSLEVEDKDQYRFVRYCIAALQTIDSALGTEAMKALHSPQPPSIQIILTALLNDIDEEENQIILILDDYHLINSDSINGILVFFLEHLPQNMHLVIISREDPGLPLARYRAKNQLSEIRISDLRFSSREIKQFLNHMTELELSESDIDALELRTEGWIASLQLAAISMRQTKDIRKFIAEFTGTNRFIIDYLLQEILEQQTEQIQSFLMSTSILDRMNASLCDALLADESVHSSELLHQLERANLLLIPLDEQQEWYRYHHLFAEALQARFSSTDIDRFTTLHMRACEWFESRGFLPDAIKHAFAANDLSRAADLIELSWSNSLQEFNFFWFLEMITRLPEELIYERPVLNTGYAWYLIIGGDLPRGEDRLQFVDEQLGISAGHFSPKDRLPNVIVNDADEFQMLPGTLATARAFACQIKKDLLKSIEHGKAALNHLPAEEEFRRAIAEGTLAFSYWERGELDKAEDFLWISRRTMQRANRLADALSGSFFIATIKVTLGKLQEAISFAKDSITLAENQDHSIIPGRAELYFGLAELLLENGNEESAVQYISAGEALLNSITSDDRPYRFLIVKAKILEDLGEIDAAIQLLLRTLQDDNSPVSNDYVPTPKPPDAIIARLWIKQNKLENANEWARKRSISTDDSLSYITEYEHITLARLMLAEYEKNQDINQYKTVQEFLDRLILEAIENHRIASLIELKILQAILCFQNTNSIDSSFIFLEEAFNLAEAEGYIRVFTSEGQRLFAILKEAQNQNIAHSFLPQLLSHFTPPSKKSAQTKVNTNTNEILMEQLSERELEVLRLLQSDLNGPEIANMLFISLNTLRTHTKNIYIKLNVNGRRQAVRRSKELGLI